MSLSSNCGDVIILVWKPASHGKIFSDNCHSVSPFCVALMILASSDECSLGGAPQLCAEYEIKLFDISEGH